MAPVKIFTGPFCPYCGMAKQLLAQLGVAHMEEVRIDRDPAAFQEMQQITGQRTVPQIFIGQTHVGGFTDLYALHQKGELMRLLQMPQ